MRLYTEHLHETLFAALSKSEERVRIISPFLTGNMIEDLCHILSLKGVRCTLISRFPESALISNEEALRRLFWELEEQVEIYDREELHAKIYIIDDKVAFLGSANFTDSGLARNYEVLVSIEKDSEPEQFQALLDYIAPWKDKRYQVTENMVERYGGKKAGAEKQKREEKSALFRFPERPKQRKWREPTVWLKYVGNSANLSGRRRESQRSYTPPHSEKLGIDYLAFPEGQPPAGISRGDIVYVAFLGADKISGERSTFIVGRGISKGFDRTQPLQKELSQERDRLHVKRWPIYLELEQVSAFPGAIQDAMEISEVWKKEGREHSYIPRGSHLRIFRPQTKALLGKYSQQFQGRTQIVRNDTNGQEKESR